MEIINSEVEVVHNVCIYNKYGYCKFRRFCKFQHFQDICSKVSCDIERCLLRYPKVCSYYEEFSYCKFGSFCSYLHRKQGLRNSEIIHQEQSKHDIKVLKVQLPRITCAQNRPSPINQVLPIASSLSYRPP